jgi:hypothetical protein
LEEASYMTFANVTPTWRSEAIASTSTSGAFIFSNALSATNPNKVDISANGNLDSWTVQSGALAPKSITAFGRRPNISTTPTLVRGTSFDDGVTVASNSRKVVINCSSQSNLDRHCATAFTIPMPKLALEPYQSISRRLSCPFYLYESSPTATKTALITSAEILKSLACSFAKKGRAD